MSYLFKSHRGRVIKNQNLSSPDRGIALAAILPSQPTSQWISAVRVQIAVKMNRIAKVISTMHIALHKSPVSVPSRALTSRDSHRGLQKYIASQTCIARCGELRSEVPKSPFFKAFYHMLCV